MAFWSILQAWPHNFTWKFPPDGQWLFLVPLKGYTANWGVICHLPPFRGTRNNHWDGLASISKKKCPHQVATFHFCPPFPVMDHRLLGHMAMASIIRWFSPPESSDQDLGRWRKDTLISGTPFKPMKWMALRDAFPYIFICKNTVKWCKKGRRNAEKDCGCGQMILESFGGTFSTSNFNKGHPGNHMRHQASEISSYKNLPWKPGQLPCPRGIIVAKVDHGWGNDFVSQQTLDCINFRKFTAYLQALQPSSN